MHSVRKIEPFIHSFIRTKKKKITFLKIHVQTFKINRLSLRLNSMITVLFFFLLSVHIHCYVWWLAIAFSSKDWLGKKGNKNSKNKSKIKSTNLFQIGFGIEMAVGKMGSEISGPIVNTMLSFYTKFIQ